ncbi:MAG: tetratricopeptide repeat protein [Chloroflexota bacterium]
MISLQVRRTTRTIAPRRRSDTLRRPRLLDFLWHHLDCRLLLVCAPAGFGKTTLVVDFAAESKTPVCWYTLSQLDRDPAVFLGNLVESIRTRFPAFRSKAESRIAATSDIMNESGQVLAVLAADIQSSIPEPFTIVLDDFHHLDDSEDMTRFVNLLLESIPDRCHLMIISRTMPRLAALPKLLSRREVAALGMDDLRFTPGEVAELFHRSYGISLSPEEAAGLASDSGGWVAGLILTSRTLWKGLLQQLVAQKGRGGALFEYLSQEVYNELPAELRQFVLTTGILSELEPQLCNELLGIENAQHLLEELEGRNLFLSRLDSERPVYRLHQLFQEFLKAKLEAEDHQRYSGLNLKAAAIHEKKGNWEEAIKHYGQAGGWCDCGRVVAKAGEELMRAGRWQTLSRWIEGLPQEVLDSNPELLLRRAQAAIRCGETDMAIRLCNRAMEVSAKIGDTLCIVRALLCRSSALRLVGQPRASMADVRRALALLRERPEENRLIAEARRQLGAIYGQQGDFARARRQLEKSLPLYVKAGELADVSRVHDLLGIACSQLGQLDRATMHFERAKQGWHNLSNWSELATTLNNMGELYRLKGDHERALAELDLALMNARRSGNTQSEAWILETIGDVKQDRGEYEAAIEEYNGSIELARRGLDARLVTRCTRALADSYRLMGRYDDARFLIDQAICQAKERNSNYESGLCLSSLGLVKSARGEHREAMATLHEAARLVEHSGNKRELARTYFYLAQACLSAKNYMAAVRHLSKLASLLDELGGDDFLLADARRSTWLVEYAASKRIGDDRFAQLLAKLQGRRNTLESGVPLPRVEAFAFGPGRVVVDGREVSETEWRSKKSKELFFYLLSHRRGATKEQVFEALWPEWSPDRCNTCFHPTAHRLRGALYPDCLRFQEGRYVLHPGGGTYYDMTDFEKLISQADQLPRGSEERASRLHEAVALYRGTFLEDFYSEWCETLRRKLESQYVRALASLGGYYAANGQYAMAIELLERCLAIDRYQEDAQYELMNAHLLAGNPGGTVQCYRRYADILRSELAIEPPKRMKELLLTVATKV